MDELNHSLIPSAINLIQSRKEKTMKVNQFEEISVIQELDDEVAATCSGGEGQTGGPNPDVILYKDEFFNGADLKVNAKRNDGLSNLENYGGFLGFGTFNDSISSFEIKRGLWNFYADKDYKGLYNNQPLGPGKYRTLARTGISNDSLSSLKRVG
jgi:hypothetical protein